MPRLKYNLDEISTLTMEPGRYRARLVKCEQTLSRSRNPMLVWYWKVVEGEAKGKEIRSFTVLVDGQMGNLKEHLEAFKYRGMVDVDSSKLVGKFVTLVVGTAVRNNDGVDREFSAVVGVFPDEKKARRVVEEEIDDEDEDEEEYDDEDEDDEEDDYEDEEDEDDDEDDEDEEEEVRPSRRPTKSSSRRASKPAPKPKPKTKRRRIAAEDDDVPF